jgi:hypothetical protein
MARARRKATPHAHADAPELNAEQSDALQQRVVAMRRRRAALLEALKAQHAARPKPLPLWLSLGVIAFLVWGIDFLSQRVWGLENVVVPVKPEF